MSARPDGVFDDMDGKFDARLRRVFPSTKTAKNGDQEIVVTNIVASVEARFDFQTLERLYSPNFVAIERQGKGAGSYLIFEVVGVNPMHFQMLGMDVSMPTLLRREYLDTISESWGRSQETWIDMGAIPTWYSMTVEGGKATFDKSRVLPLAGRQGLSPLEEDRRGVPLRPQGRGRGDDARVRAPPHHKPGQPDQIPCRPLRLHRSLENPTSPASCCERS